MGMNAEKLSARSKQPGNDRTFRKSESAFLTALKTVFSDDVWTIEDHPRDLSKMLGGKYGIIPEASLRHLITGKVMYFEVKKQGSAGNADERAAKHHTVAFYRNLQSVTGMPFHAFTTIMCEALATDLRYTTKHPFFFEENRYFCWVDYDFERLQVFLKQHIEPLLTT